MNEQRGNNGRHSNEDRGSHRMREQTMQEQRRNRDDDNHFGEDRDRDRGDGYGSSERGYGQGQSGYMAGRYGEDRSLGRQGMNQGYDERGNETTGNWYGGGGNRFNDPMRHQGLDDRWSGRGGQDYARQYGGRDMQGGGYGGEQYGSRQDSGAFGPERGSGYNYYGENRGRSFGGYGDNQMMNRGYGSSSAQSGENMNRGYAGSSEQRQTHRGKGPKNFQRSDERLRELVSEALSDDHDIDASQIEVEVKNGEVTLKGTVEDRRTKRLAEDCVERIPGISDVQNQIRVGNNRQGTMRGNPTSNGQVGTSETDRSKHRA